MTRFEIQTGDMHTPPLTGPHQSIVDLILPTPPMNECMTLKVVTSSAVLFHWRKDCHIDMVIQATQRSYLLQMSVIAKAALPPSVEHLSGWGSNQQHSALSFQARY